MEKESFAIVNENEHDICGDILRADKKGKRKCMIFSHGLLDTKKTVYISTLCKKFLDDGWVVVVYDSTQSFGESGGNPEYITISQKVEDLEKVIGYAKRRSYVDDKKIVVFGHCYGAMAALAMEGFEHLLAGIILVSVPSRIEETKLTRKSSHEMMKIKLKRYFHIHHEAKGTEVRINYSFYEDGMKQDMDRAARNLKTPALFIHGSKDDSIPLESTERMFARAIGDKEMVIIDSMAHEIKGISLTKVFDATKEFFDGVFKK